MGAVVVRRRARGKKTVGLIGSSACDKSAESHAGAGLDAISLVHAVIEGFNILDSNLETLRT